MVVLMFAIVVFALCTASFLAIAARAARSPRTREPARPAGPARPAPRAQLSRLDRMDGVHTDGRRAYHGRHSAHTPRHVA